MAIFGNKDKSGNFTINFFNVEGTPIYDRSERVVIVTLLEDKMEFKLKVMKKVIYLKYSQITKFSSVNEEEIVEVNKSVIKRALVGNLLLGPLGAMIGAVDGTGTKKVSKGKKSYFVINYISGTGTEEALPLEIVGGTFGIDKFIDKLAKVCPNLKFENKDNSIESGTYL